MIAAAVLVAVVLAVVLAVVYNRRKRAAAAESKPSYVSYKLSTDA